MAQNAAVRIPSHNSSFEFSKPFGFRVNGRNVQRWNNKHVCDTRGKHASMANRVSETNIIAFHSAIAAFTTLPIFATSNGFTQSRITQLSEKLVTLIHCEKKLKNYSPFWFPSSSENFKHLAQAIGNASSPQYFFLNSHFQHMITDIKLHTNTRTRAQPETRKRTKFEI